MNHFMSREDYAEACKYINEAKKSPELMSLKFNLLSDPNKVYALVRSVGLNYHETRRIFSHMDFASKASRITIGDVLNNEKNDGSWNQIKEYRMFNHALKN